MEFLSSFTWRAAPATEDSKISECINEDKLVELIDIRNLNFSIRSNLKLNKYLGEFRNAKRLVSLAFGDSSLEDDNSFINLDDTEETTDEIRARAYSRASDVIGFCEQNTNSKMNFVLTVTKNPEILSIPFEHLCNWCIENGVDINPETCNKNLDSREINTIFAPPLPFLISKSFQRLIGLLISDSSISFQGEFPPYFPQKRNMNETPSFGVALTYFILNNPRYLYAWIACASSPLVFESLRTFVSDANTPFPQLCSISKMMLTFSAIGIEEDPIEEEEDEEEENKIIEVDGQKIYSCEIIHKKNIIDILMIRLKRLLEDVAQADSNKDFERIEGNLSMLHKTQMIYLICSVFNNILTCKARSCSTTSFADTVDRFYLSNKSAYPVMVEYLIKRIFKDICPYVPKLSVFNGPSMIVVPYVIDICISSFAIMLMGGAVICLDGILRAVYEYSYVYTKQLEAEITAKENGNNSAKDNSEHADSDNDIEDSNPEPMSQKEDDDEDEEENKEKVIIKHLPEVVERMIDGAETITETATDVEKALEGKWTFTSLKAVNSYLTETLADFYCTVSLSEHISLSESFNRSYSNIFVKALKAMMKFEDLLDDKEDKEGRIEGQRKVRLFLATRLLYITNDLRKLLNSHPLYSLRIVHETIACLRLKAENLKNENEDVSHYIVFLQDILERIRKFAGSPYIKNMNMATNGYNETMDYLRKEYRRMLKNGTETKIEEMNEYNTSTTDEVDEDEEDGEDDDDDDSELKTPSYLTFSIALASVSSLMFIASSSGPTPTTQFFYMNDIHTMGLNSPNQVSLSSVGTSLEWNLWPTNNCISKNSVCFESTQKDESTIDIILECEDIIDMRKKKIVDIGKNEEFYLLQGKGEEPETKDLIMSNGIDSDKDTTLMNKVVIPNLLNICIIETDNKITDNDPERKSHIGSKINMLTVVNEILGSGIVIDAVDLITSKENRTTNQQFYVQLAAKLIIGVLEYTACQPSICVRYIKYITNRLMKQISADRKITQYNFKNKVQNVKANSTEIFVNYDIDGEKGPFLLPPKRRTGKYVIALGLIDFINKYFVKSVFSIIDFNQKVDDKLSEQQILRTDDKVTSYSVGCYLNGVKSLIQNMEEADEKNSLNLNEFKRFLDNIDEDNSNHVLEFTGEIEKEPLLMMDSNYTGNICALNEIGVQNVYNLNPVNVNVDEENEEDEQINDRFASAYPINTGDDDDDDEDNNFGDFQSGITPDFGAFSNSNY